jgi:hypothetical protein
MAFVAIHQALALTGNTVISKNINDTLCTYSAVISFQRLKRINLNAPGRNGSFILLRVIYNTFNTKEGPNSSLE